MAMDPTNAPLDRKLFVGGLMPFTNEQALGAHFQHFGAIEEVKIIYDKHTGRSKGYGFVLFREESAAQAAATNPNPTVDGKQCNCNLASLNAKPAEKGANGRLRQKRAQPYGSGPMGMEFSQPKRMKIDNSPVARVSYIQQLTKDGQPAPTKEGVLERVRTLKSENNILEAFGYLVEMWELFKPESDQDFAAELKDLTALVREIRSKQADEDGIAQDDPEPATTTSATNADGADGSAANNSSDSSNAGTNTTVESGNTAQEYADAYQDGYHADEHSDAAQEDGQHGGETFGYEEHQNIDENPDSKASAE
eukprot:TRINITY_DN5512_c0_g1_i1.p1 TRINITY_DN5512_c0_g1~~TRINITY_DN5512_c0_g1_i1.p1  ORF type:complete len:309 (-),score=64.82 TRINITY_DN5512_c0_g1_i1:104-1030(-)